MTTHVDYRRTAEILERLDTVTDAALAHPTLDELLPALLARVGELLSADTAAILLADESSDVLHVRAAQGLEDDAVRRVEITLPGSVRGRLATQRSAVLLSDEDRTDAFGGLARRAGVRSAAAAPLQVRGELIGVLHVGSATRTFTEEDAELLTVLGHRVALAVEQSRLFEAERRARAEAEAAQRRFRFLAEASTLLASSLRYETTLASVAQLAVPQLADWCVVDLMSGDGSIQRVAVVCADPDRQPLADELQRRYPPRPERPEGTPKVLRSGAPELITDVSDEWLSAIAPDPQTLEILRSLDLRSNILVPLSARGRTLGVLTLATAESGRRYDESDLELAEELALRAGLAVDNARLYRDAEEAALRKSAQYEATRILAESDSLTRAGPALLATLCDVLEWDVGGLWTPDPSGQVIRCAEIWRRRSPKLGAFEAQTRALAFEPGVGLPGRVWKSGEPTWILNVVEDANFPRAAAAAAGELHSAFAFPIVLADEVVGVIELFTPEVREPDEDLLEMMTAVGRQIGQFIQRERAEGERARLLARERGARAEAEAARRRFQFLAEASELLASSLDYERTLESVASLAVPTLADWCVIDMVEQGRVRRLTVAHADPAQVRWARELELRYPLDPDSEHGPPNVIRTGISELIAEISDEMLVQAARDEAHLAALREVGLHSYMCVPLVSRGRILGAITLVAAESDRRFDESDLAFTEELARRAATAADNAELYREAEERAHAARVLTNIGDGVFLLDGDGVIRLWNAAAERITGIATESAVGRAATAAIPGWATLERLVPVASADSPSAARAETIPIEIDGREVWLSISGVGFEEGTVYAFRDFTEERAVERLKSDFISTVSHELRTPLAAIYGAAMTLRREDISMEESQRERLLLMVAEESDRLARRVKDILAVGSLEAGAFRFELQTFDAGELVRDVVDSARDRLPADVDVETAVAPGLPPVMADRDKVSQVLSNLVDNAVKYSPRGGTIAVGVHPYQLRLRFSVRDEGLGIPETELERIFEKFYRLDPNMTHGVSGTGLGLYICRELVRRMGGRIWVSSKQGEGSTFFFELPIAEPSAIPGAQAERQTGSASVKRAPVGTASS